MPDTEGVHSQTASFLFVDRAKFNIRHPSLCFLRERRYEIWAGLFYSPLRSLNEENIRDFLPAFSLVVESRSLDIVPLTGPTGAVLRSAAILCPFSNESGPLSRAFFSPLLNWSPLRPQIFGPHKKNSFLSPLILKGSFRALFYAVVFFYPFYQENFHHSPLFSPFPKIYGRYLQSSSPLI